MNEITNSFLFSHIYPMYVYIVLMKGVTKSIYICVLYPYKGDHRGKAKTVHEPGSRFSLDTGSACALTLDFPASGTSRNQ